MKIVNRKTFLALPAGTVYAKFEPCIFGSLSIKGDTCGTNDWFEVDIASALDCHSSGNFVDTLMRAERTGESIPMDFEGMGRDGLYDDDQLFAVWEQPDVAGLVKVLTRTP